MQECCSDGKKIRQANKVFIIFVIRVILLRPATLDVTLHASSPFGVLIRDGQNLNRDRERQAAHKAHGINQEALLSYRSNHLPRSPRFSSLPSYPFAIRYYSSTWLTSTVTSEGTTVDNYIRGFADLSWNLSKTLHRPLSASIVRLMVIINVRLFALPSTQATTGAASTYNRLRLIARIGMSTY